MSKWQQGTYQVKNTHKYIGSKLPTFRSSWERAFCQMCDDHPNIVKWASENIKIPYMNPVSNRMANYVPDFMVQYIDKDGNQFVELIEIKPSKETTLENANSVRDRAAVAVNTAKWQAASQWCAQQGIRFKVINEDQIFHKPKGNKSKRQTRSRVPKKR